MFRRIFGVALLCFGSMAPGACSVTVTAGRTVDRDTLERKISDVLATKVRRPESVACPGPIKVEAGAKAWCVLTGDRVRYGVTTTVTAVDGARYKLDVKVGDRPLPAGA
ncbi:MAG TPA: DUF4333 domain-containing protein [Amycolatopsis sp.]|uniref:DUF4333 domain-containing protein n=1 Tax=Amycolatopsis sp. TaxID=37632 RepID=UPI002B474A54|nr:DUF4333 domain-containing protein [Amycolatopsis sp.]HKS43991.1 DUF4333 domain-containing protein [Amycolatopsis sp.]